MQCKIDSIEQKSNYSELEASRIIQQLLVAVDYCHSHDIVHRDLKPDNIMLESKKEESNIKLIDFGEATMVDDNEMYNEFGMYSSIDINTTSVQK